MDPSAQDAIYLHAPCFDGLVSAAVAQDHLETVRGWRIGRVEPVTYDLAPVWLSTRLPGRAAVVDFPYHPDAAFWLDHHPTAFLGLRARLGYIAGTARAKLGRLAAAAGLGWPPTRGRTLIYDPRAKSAAGLLWRHVGRESSDPGRYAEMVRWAERTDSADYADPEEATFGDAPALRINQTMAGRVDAGYVRALLAAARTMTLAEISRLPFVEERVAAVRESGALAIEDVRRAIRVEDGIATFEVRAESDHSVPRYAAYLLRPEARYAVALVHSRTGSKVSASRNPWIDFECVDLGAIMRRLGRDGSGGGHRRVGSLTMPGADPACARTVFARVVASVRAGDSTRTGV